MGLAVRFKWRVWSLLSLSLVVLIANLAVALALNHLCVRFPLFKRSVFLRSRPGHLVSTRYLPTWVLLADEFLVSILSTWSNERENDQVFQHLFYICMKFIP